MEEVKLFVAVEFKSAFSSPRNLFSVVGALYAAKVFLGLAYSVLNSVRVYFLSRLWLSRTFVSAFGGQWAVVTGASDGIGKAFARELANYGMNIILISRSTEKLKKVAKEIEAEYKVKTHIVAVDFSKQDNEVYDKVAECINLYRVGVLVNNVGVMYDYPQYFLDVPEKRLRELININIATTVMMTYLVLPQMVSRKCGAVVNMSSSAAEFPTPQMTVYSASKDFVDHFSRALAHEYSKDGIVIQSLRPYYVSTAMTHHTKPNLAIPSAETYVHNALPTLTASHRNCGYWSHALQGWFLSFCPAWLWMWGANLLNNKIRESVLKFKEA